MTGKQYAMLMVTGLCLLIMQGCAGHSGVLLIQPGYDPITIDEESVFYPRGDKKEFTIGPGDVLRVEAAIYTAPSKKFLLEKGSQILLTFHSVKEGDYHVMAGDELRIGFLTDSSLNFDITVRLDGRISIPKIGEIDVVGKTPGEIGMEITGAYRGKIDDPRIIISVLRSNTEPINLMAGEYTVMPDGDVNLPVLGTFPAAGISLEDLQRNISAVVQERFHNNFAASVVATNIATQQIEQYDRVVTVTPSGGIILPKVGYLTVAGLTLTGMKTAIQDALRARYSNDVDVFITFIAGGTQSVYVGGEVRFPGTYPFAPGMTMLKAVMAAGSATSTSA
ncbi:MAG: polysaccharide biosynthesis/export family protein, partial [Thermodesulfobacteriota bacterium]